MSSPFGRRTIGCNCWFDRRCTNACSARYGFGGTPPAALATDAADFLFQLQHDRGRRCGRRRAASVPSPHDVLTRARTAAALPRAVTARNSRHAAVERCQRAAQRPPTASALRACRSAAGTAALPHEAADAAVAAVTAATAAAADAVTAHPGTAATVGAPQCGSSGVAASAARSARRQARDGPGRYAPRPVSAAREVEREGVGERERRGKQNGSADGR